jgi:antitoxin (DNA-binding transcriptional repressor) of toxin-antitoxin stability system
MITYSAYDAKAKLSALLDRVETLGEVVIITRHGKPITQATPFEPPQWAPTWTPKAELAVVFNDDAVAPTFPNGFPDDPSDPV